MHLTGAGCAPTHLRPPAAAGAVARRRQPAVGRSGVQRADADAAPGPKPRRSQPPAAGDPRPGAGDGRLARPAARRAAARRDRAGRAVRREFARRGVSVTGVDFGPASLRYAAGAVRDLPCQFIQSDVREMDFAGQDSTRRSTSTASSRCCARPSRWTCCGASVRHCGPAASSCWRSWTTPVRQEGRHLVVHRQRRTVGRLSLTCTWASVAGIRIQRARVERFHILNLETGEMQVYGLSDQAYTVAQVTAMLQEAGFGHDGAFTRRGTVWR